MLCLLAADNMFLGGAAGSQRTGLARAPGRACRRSLTALVIVEQLQETGGRPGMGRSASELLPPSRRRRAFAVSLHLAAALRTATLARAVHRRASHSVESCCRTSLALGAAANAAVHVLDCRTHRL